MEMLLLPSGAHEVSHAVEVLGGSSDTSLAALKDSSVDVTGICRKLAVLFYRIRCSMRKETVYVCFVHNGFLHESLRAHVQ